MAISVSNHPLLWPPAPSAFFSSKPIPLRTLPLFSAPANHGLGFSAPTLRPVKLSHTPILRFPLAATEKSSASNVDSNDDLEVASEDSLSMSEVSEAYKQAIVSGDEKRIFDIEAKICTMVVRKQELDDKLSSLSADINSGKEKYIRLQADFDNFRKRSNKEVVALRDSAQREVIENLLAMVDNFEAARKQIKAETEKEKKIDTSYQGIYKQFVEVLRSWNVSAIATVGKPFDPLLHEAVGREESEEFKAGIVIQELRRGFRLQDRVLRPAKVKVSLGPVGKKTSASTNGSSTQTAETVGVNEQ